MDLLIYILAGFWVLSSLLLVALMVFDCISVYRDHNRAIFPVDDWPEMRPIPFCCDSDESFDPSELKAQLLESTPGFVPDEVSWTFEGGYIAHDEEFASMMMNEYGREDDYVVFERSISDIIANRGDSVSILDDPHLPPEELANDRNTCVDACGGTSNAPQPPDAECGIR